MTPNVNSADFGPERRIGPGAWNQHVYGFVQRTGVPERIDEAEQEVVELIIRRVRDARFAGGVQCPRCSSRRVQGWGRFSGRRRYRCRGCSRTFSDLTGTPAAYCKKLDRWTELGRCLEAALSVRASAARLGVWPSTAFRWRHRLCDGLRQNDADTVFGWIELCGLWMAHSQKGQRGLQRPARRRGVRNLLEYRLQNGGVMVRFAAARDGAVVASVGRPIAAGSADWMALIQERIRGHFAGIVGHNPYSPRTLVLHGLDGVQLDPVRRIASDRPGSLLHLNHVLPYRERFKRWLRRFRGVATKYLGNYLVWHRCVDGAWRNRFEALVLRWPACGQRQNE